MRVVFSLMTLVILIFVLGFAITNMDTRVSVRVIETVYPDVRLAVIAILAVVIGAIYTGVIAVAEGAAIRLANRRLQRSVQKLENELNELRTQPTGPARPEPDAIPGRESGPAEGPRAESPREYERPPSAPVYEPEQDLGDHDPGDDAYSGGRGV